MLVFAIRTAIIYLLILIAIRVMGKRQIGEMRPSELVVALLIADIAVVPMQDDSIPLSHGIIPMCVLVALELLLSIIMMKCPTLERLVSGNPVPIIKGGKLDVGALKKLRLSVDDLMEALRQQNCFSLDEVDYAVAEAGGGITIFLRPPYRPATARDVGAKPEDSGMPALVIADGSVCQWGLQLCGKTAQQLNALLIRNGYAQKQIFLMTLSANGSFFILTADGKTQSGEATI